MIEMKGRDFKEKIMLILRTLVIHKIDINNKI